MLTPDDFATFFREVHGVDPFPWQLRLLKQVAASDRGHWPSTLDLPTGSGKTAAIDIALFHLALEAARGELRRAPLRVAFVVDRRLVVDDAHARASKLQAALTRALIEDDSGKVTRAVAQALKGLAGDGPPLIARRMRGGIPREDDWARTPSQPTVLCSTVDQIGSRLLFRGYGVSDSMKPVHAGLIGADCLMLLDEAHLAEPFRQTLAWVETYRSQQWRESAFAAPWSTVVLTATPGRESPASFRLNDTEDGANPVLRRRLQARKPARLRLESHDEARQQAFVDEVRQALAGGAQAIGVVLNRVARARTLFNRLKQEIAADLADVILLIGPSRPIQRDAVTQRLAPIRTGEPRPLARPLIVVATQSIEAGVDIDLDALFTEAAPLDSLRQRFGRLNRDGRDVVANAAIIATKEETSARAEDPVYGAAIRNAWQALDAAAEAPPQAGRKRKQTSDANAWPQVDFGIAHFQVPMAPAALTDKPNAPVLMPSHVDMLTQTAPIPGADPDVALYLHGPMRQPDAVTLVWRADLMPGDQSGDIARRLALVPPRGGEGIDLPVWTVRRWLNAPAEPIDALADLPMAAEEGKSSVRAFGSRRAIRWRPHNDETTWVAGEGVRPGDTLVVPSSYGGIDEHGWDPACELGALDVADEAAAAFAGRYFAVRVAPGLLADENGVTPEQLAMRLAELQAEPWSQLRDGLLRLPLSPHLANRLRMLDHVRRRRGRQQVEVHLDAYGALADGSPRGVVFVARRGLMAQPGTADISSGFGNSTEDDAIGSAPGYAQSLAQHSAEVEAKAESFAAAVGLPQARIADLKLAGWFHDHGKRDARFQRWMHHDDPLGADPDDERTVLAKSGRPLPPAARRKAGLPPHWRHEACSVRLALTQERLKSAHDPELVLWLIGTHHGHGRPLFPHEDPTETGTDVGPQSPLFLYEDNDWPTLFQILKARYGAWELARMEAILRLADHRASEFAATLAEENPA